MIKIDKRTNKDGTTRTQIRVVEGYRPGPSMPTKQRTIKDFGCLEDQKDKEAFMDMVKEFNATYRKENVPLKIEALGTEVMYSPTNRRLNYGYKFLETVYDKLMIGSFIKDYKKSKRFKGDYLPEDIFKFLVFSRILNPDSKRASCQGKDNFYDMDTAFSLEDIYRSLDLFSKFEKDLYIHLNECIKKSIGRDFSHVFFDVTNYYFEIDFPDSDEDLRQRGVSKEHRSDPIVAMGLFMDRSGLPINMSIFPGNTSDTLTLRPTMKDIKGSYNLDRIIVVADKGLNSSKNIDEIVNNGDGYVFSQSIKGKVGQRYSKYLNDENGWITNSDNTYRYKIFTESYEGKTKTGQIETRKRKVLLYWNKAQADMANQRREDKLKRTEKSISNNTHSIKRGVDEYKKEDIVDKSTGEILSEYKKHYSLDIDKVDRDKAYDGYFCIITSELDYDEKQIRFAYGSLWKIEQSFRILKSDLYVRPVFLRNNDHIRAHFLICFVALLILRIIQYHMGQDVLSIERICRTLNKATCRLLKGGIIHLDDVGGALEFKKIQNKKGKLVDTLVFSNEDEIAMDFRKIQNTFGSNFNNIYLRQEVFNRLLKNMSI